MTDMQRWRLADRGEIFAFYGDESGDGYVLASDAEAAIAAAIADERTYADMNVHAAYDKGQRDMLARCIAAVEALYAGDGFGLYGVDGKPIREDDIIAALRGLENNG